MNWNITDPINYHPSLPSQEQRSRQVNEWMHLIQQCDSLRPQGLAVKPPRPKDLTPKQIEWCKAWIPAFLPRGVKSP